MTARLTFRLFSVVGVLSSVAGCGVGQDGIAPPLDEILLPAGLAVDPNGDWLYVVNANGDLRYNAGTLTAVDLRKAVEDRSDPAAAAWATCTRTRFTGDEEVADRFCCRDMVDDRVLNCNDRGYVKADTTVKIGSFGGAMVLQRDPELATRRRLYLTVRAEPSITFADVTVDDSGPRIRCTGERGSDTGTAPMNASCDDNWRIRRPSNSEVYANVLPEEPHTLALNEELGILFVGHLAQAVNGQIVGGGVSSIDVCGGPDVASSPRFRNVSRTVFPGAASQSVTDLSLNGTGPNAPLFAIERSGSEIEELVLRDASQGTCDLAAPRTNLPDVDLSVVPGQRILSSAFQPAGTSLRGLVLSPGAVAAMQGTTCTGSATSCRQEAYVLHRNEGTSDPAALVVLDRRPDETGQPANRPVAVVEVCLGPTDLQMHDAGRGNMLYVTCFEGGQMYVIDPALLEVTAIIETGRSPNALVFSPDGQTAYVANYADNSISVIDLVPGSPTEFRVVQRLGFPHAVTE